MWSLLLIDLQITVLMIERVCEHSLFTIINFMHIIMTMCVCVCCMVLINEKEGVGGRVREFGKLILTCDYHASLV